MSFKSRNLNDLLVFLSEDELTSYLKSFKCDNNFEIEHFLHYNAVDFARRKMATTYLVVDAYEEIAAYYTLTHKAVEIPCENLSSSMKKKISRFSQLDEERGSFTVSAFLIAQFGKNSSYNGERLSGNSLMDTALNVFSHVQYEVGGSIVYLECEDKEKLLNFYTNNYNHYVLFNERFSKSENVEYKQLLRFI